MRPPLRYSLFHGRSPLAPVEGVWQDMETVWECEF
jgi:hypothetical protein